MTSRAGGTGSNDTGGAMDPRPPERLTELIAGDGQGLMHDAQRLRASLEDAFPMATREVSVLVAAVEENLPLALARNPAPLTQADLERYARSLAHDRALTPEAARWSVQSWASAL